MQKPPLPRWSYSPTQPYPGKHSTLLVAILYAFLAVLLVIVNIPLSAYDTEQIFVTNPNDTISDSRLPYSHLVPSLLRRDPGDFISHPFSVGDTYHTNFSSFTGQYTLVSAFNRSDPPGSSVPQVGSALSNFEYRNYNLRTCDVLQITLEMTFGGNWKAAVSQATAIVSCWYPNFYVSEVELSYLIFDYLQGNKISDPLHVMHTVGGMLSDLSDMIYTTDNFTIQGSSLNNYTGDLTVTFEQCCTTCGDPSYIAGTPNNPSTPIEAYETPSPDVISTSTLLYDHPSCDDQEVMFKSSITSFQSSSGYTTDHLQSIDSFGIGTNLPTAINNTLRAIYHAIRLDLGVIRPNQIYNSPARFNASIANITFPARFNLISFVSSTFAERAGIGNVDLSNASYNVHVPNILYLTPRFKRKPMPQAIAAVFVSAFSMLLAMWHAFNFVASSIVQARAKLEAGSKSGKGPLQRRKFNVFRLGKRLPQLGVEFRHITWVCNNCYKINTDQ